MNSIEIGEIVKEKLKYRQEYASLFEKNTSTIEESKKELAKKLTDNPDDEAIQEKIEYLFYDHNLSAQDLDQLTKELVSLYKVSNKEEFTEEEKERLEALKNEERKQTFVATKGKLEERVKGTKDKYISNLRNSPFYNKSIEFLKNSLNSH